jgi:hypothetical protein
MTFDKHLLTALALGVGALGTLGAATMVAEADDPKIAGPNSFVRVLHAVPGGPKVDVYIDGQKQLNDVTFGELSKYIRIPAGYHQVRVTSNNPTRTLLSWKKLTRNNDFYTLGMYGPTYKVRPLSYSDSAGYPAYGKARISAFHLAPGTPVVDVYGDVHKTRTSYRLFRNLRYGQIKVANAPAMPMTIRLVSRGHTIKTITGASPRAGRKYDLFAIGRERVNFQVKLDPAASQ